MSKRTVLGVLLAVVASAVTAGVVVVVGQGGGQGDEVKIPPVGALKPGELKPPAGTPLAGLPLPLDYGRFRILAEGVPQYVPDPPPPPGVKWVRADVTESDSLDEFRDNDLFIDPPYIPAGWELTSAQARTAIWDDGSSTDGTFSLEYERPQYFYIRIERFLIAPEGQVELLAPPPGSQDALILNEIRGVPVVFLYQGPLQVHFVMDNVVTYVEGVAIDFDELIKIADGLIAETQEAAQAGPSPPPNAKFIPGPSKLWTAVDYTENGWPIVADELIVKFRDGVPEEEREAILREVGAQTKKIREFSRTRVVKVDPAQREQILKELSSNENIEIVERNLILQADTLQ
jgi:hypothetical protein